MKNFFRTDVLLILVLTIILIVLIVLNFSMKPPSTRTTQNQNQIGNATTTNFGNNATGDLNGDGLPDIAMITTENPGGSGTFFYVVVELKTSTSTIKTNSIFLGDRIAPQTTEIKNGVLIVNYADRKPSDPMTTQPSVGVSRYFKVVGGELVEVK